MHSWKDTLDYSSNTMDSALQYEKFMNVSAKFLPEVFGGHCGWCGSSGVSQGTVMATWCHFLELIAEVKAMFTCRTFHSAFSGFLPREYVTFLFQGISVLLELCIVLTDLPSNNIMSVG